MNGSLSQAQIARGPEKGGSRIHERWAHLRFSVIGQLLAAPPAKGELHGAFERLAAREWQHPTTGAPVRFGVSTIERWYYRALNERRDPVGVLRRNRRQDAGEQASMNGPLRQALLAQYAAHKSWSAKLHHDNLVALACCLSQKCSPSRVASSKNAPQADCRCLPTVVIAAAAGMAGNATFSPPYRAFRLAMWRGRGLAVGRSGPNAPGGRVA